MKASIYARTAVENLEAMDRQADRCRAYVRDQGWEVIGTWTGIGSGLDVGRTELASFRAAMWIRDVNAVVATTLDRVDRHLELMHTVVDEARDAQAIVAFTDDDPVRQKVRGALSTQIEEEIKR